MASIKSGGDYEAGPMGQEFTNRARAAIHYAAKRFKAKATTWTETTDDGRKVIHFKAWTPVAREAHQEELERAS